MTVDKIKQVEADIKRLLKYTESVKDHLASQHNIWPSKDRAALRRASLDLTRSLAELRRT
jgi:hypothetical protein